jgi:hypothetical protein
MSKAAVHAINRTHAPAPSLASSNTMVGKLPVEWMTPRTFPVRLGRSRQRYHGRGEWVTLARDFPSWLREVVVNPATRFRPLRVANLSQLSPRASPSTRKNKSRPLSERRVFGTHLKTPSGCRSRYLHHHHQPAFPFDRKQHR